MVWNEGDTRSLQVWQTKGLRVRTVCKRVIGLGELILKELEELPGGRSLEPRHGRNVPKQQDKL